MERNLGEQPIKNILQEHHFKSHDVVAASTENITHKMIARAVKGRWLTPQVRRKILNALNKTCEKQYILTDLFNY